MATSSEEGSKKPRTIYFQLCYITWDFDFGDSQIQVSDTDKKMDFLLRKRTSDDAPNPTLPLQAGDGFASVTRESEVAERLYTEAEASGYLSIKKGAVRLIHDEMYNQVLRLVRLIRWRANCHHGRPNPIRSGIGFTWSLDSVHWKTVADNLSLIITAHMVPQWKGEAQQFLEGELSGQLDEPLGHELLREAWTNRHANPRSAIVLAVAAAEVGFKQFAMNALPDSAWLLESMQSPPLVKMLSQLFPWSKLKLQINGIDVTPTPPDSVTETIEKAVKLRNGIVHGQPGTLESKTVFSVLTGVRDLLYFLDVLQGQAWALYCLSAEARKHFPQVTVWPLMVTPTNPD